MSQDLVVFDGLKAEITQFVAPVLALKVTDFKSSAEAIEAGKQIKALAKKVEEARTGLVSPLNTRVKLVNDYAKGIKEPLDRVEAHIKTEINRFAVEQEKVRQEEFRKAEATRLEAERKAQEEARRIAAEQDAAHQAELERIRQEAQEVEEMFGTKVDATAKIREAEAAAERERLELDARLEREHLERVSAEQAARFDANQNQIKNVRKNWKVRVVDLNQVPKEFLIVELNESMALASARAGNIKIPGLEFYQETSVALGQNTYVPRAALEKSES